MSKHRLSPAPLPAAKRQHTNLDHRLLSTPLLNFDISLYDELVLNIFAHLSWIDLCAIQSTNRYWSRLATDNQLWKAQFIREYGRLRLRGSRGFVARRDGREVKPLPHIAKGNGDDHIDWKWMFRISSNWRRGRCEVERLKEPEISESLMGYAPHSCALLAGPITVTTSPGQLLSPPVYLHQRGSVPYILKGKHRANTATHITSLSLDQSPPSSGGSTLRVAAFYDTGEFTVFLIDHNSPQHSRRSVSYFPFTKSDRTAPIRQAAYHHPLLVTLSHSFHLSLYNLSNDTVVHTQTLTSFTSFPPTSMVLTPGSRNYRLVLAYSTPVYPAHWNAAVTVLTISSCQPSSANLPLSSKDDEDAPESAQPCTVIATRTVRSYDLPAGWIDEKALRLMREQWGRKVARVADTQTDGKWVVLAPADRLPLPASSSDSAHASIGSTSCALQLYRLHLPSSSSGSSVSAASSGGALRMTFVRMLHGHAGPVVALALADGRCVSLGADGSVWVWDLERAWGVEVEAPHRAMWGSGGSDSERRALRQSSSEREVPMGTPLGTVVFDERRIVTADSYGIDVRRFDI